MEPAWALIIENKLLYSAGMATNLKQWGLTRTDIATSLPQALLSIVNHPPVLMLVNIQLIPYPHLLKAKCAVIKYEIHDGSDLVLLPQIRTTSEVEK